MSTVTRTCQSAETWDAIYRSGRDIRTWPSEDVIRFCARRLGSSQRIMEAGCGNGANLWYLQESFDVVGVDASSEAIAAAAALCRRRLADHPTLVVGQLGHLTRGKPGCEPAGANVTIQRCSPYDAIIDCRASQHVAWADHSRVYREYCDLLKPGGWFFLLHLDYETYPDRESVDRRIGDDWTYENIDRGVYPNNGLTCLPPQRELERVVTEAGFAIERVETVQRLTDETVCSHVAIDARKMK